MLTTPPDSLYPDMSNLKPGEVWDDDEVALSTRMENADTYHVDFGARRLYMVGEIDTDGAMSMYVQKALHILDDVEGDITIHMNSIGGDVDNGFAIYDSIKACHNRVITVGTGCVWSMAAAILQAGDQRVLSENCRFMVHDGTVEVKESSLVAARARSEHYEKMTTVYYAVIAERSRNPISRVRAIGQREAFLTAKQAVRHRFADTILKKGSRL
jgi:ATP-dependent Clp protease protease subunit